MHPFRYEADCTRYVAWPTLNYTRRKPYIPLPPALPRFALPNEANEANGGNDVSVADDAAATQQRPAMTATVGPRSRRVVRRKISADSTEEVQVEDILLEAYAEEPPPPLRRTPGASRFHGEIAPSESIAMAIASAVPPPSQSAAVDALLRASDPAFAPYAPLQGQGFVNPQDYGYGYRPSGADFESQSVAPVMMATTAPPPARPVFANARANRVSRGAVVAIWSSVLVVLSVALGAAVVVGMKHGTFARLRDSAKSASLHAPSKSAPASAAASAATVRAPILAATQVVAPLPAPAPAPVVVPSTTVEALTPVPADSSLVTFPAYAQGHRVFIDGRIVAVSDGSPTKVKCGRHMVKIGTARKPRILDFACGREVIVK